MEQRDTHGRFSSAGMIGQRFGRLTVTGQAGANAQQRVTFWDCICDCGNVKLHVQRSNLRSGSVSSCGCLAKEVRYASGVARMTTHGMSRTPAYKSWNAMMSRCFLPSSGAYKDYGAKGVTVSEELRTFEGFYAVVGDRPPGTSLDRINSAGNYERGNVRWATLKVQLANRREFACRLRQSDAVRVLEMQASGMTCAAIGETFGVGVNRVYQFLWLLRKKQK